MAGPIGYDFDWKGPYRVNFNDSGLATTGKALFTPNVGDKIVGMFVEVSTAFSVTGEQIGVGYAGTSDADLAFKTVVDAVPAAAATFARKRGVGAGVGTEVATMTSDTPLVAKVVTGGNTTGVADLYFMVLPS